MTRERTLERMVKITRVLSRRQKDLTLILSNIHDPHNVSAIFRSCDAFGVPRVHLYYTDTAFPVLGSKSSASARKWVDSVRHRDAETMVAQLRQQGHQILSTGFSDSARSLIEWDLTRPTAIILGNEHDGVGPELKRLAPDEIYIPMQGMIQSLNVSVAAAVILAEAWRQRTMAGMYDRPSLDPESMQTLIEAWSRK